MQAAGVTQADLADALGVTQPTISNKINGRSPWKVHELAQAAVLLRVTPAEVLAAVSDEAA